jgi:bifunctional ADP-heptose synthase (sugar kinase/adenylyltransferase)
MPTNRFGVLKGPDRPIQNEIARATLISSLKFVHAVVIFSEDMLIDLIYALHPNVLVKGADCPHGSGGGRAIAASPASD